VFTEDAVVKGWNIKKLVSVRRKKVFIKVLRVFLRRRKEGDLVAAARQAPPEGVLRLGTGVL
jgi:hypothetical protein